MRGLQCVGLVALLLVAANGGRCASPHPLDPLSAAEIRTVVAVLQAAGSADSATRYALIDLDEPLKRDVLAWEPGQPFVRRAFVIARRDRTVYEAIVDLGAQRLERWQAIPNVESAILNEEVKIARQITTADPSWQEAMRKRGFNNFSEVFCAPLSAGYSADALEAGHRLVKVTCFAGLLQKANPFHEVFAGATLPGDPAADSFFYAVTTGARGRPETLDLFFDYLPQTQATFAKNQNIGDITLPLVVLNKDGSELSVTTTLQIRAACSGGLACLTVTVVGDFLATGKVQQHSAGEVGVLFRFHFGPSPNLAIPHAIYEVRAPLLVTGANDPAYFGVKARIDGSPLSAQQGSPSGINQISGVPTAFDHDAVGFSPAFLGAPIGAAPGAANFAASFSNNGDGLSHPAVNTYLAIGTDGASVGHVLRRGSACTVTVLSPDRAD